MKIFKTAVSAAALVAALTSGAAAQDKISIGELSWDGARAIGSTARPR